LRMSLRVSHPLRSTSDHCGPKALREYPVFGALPLTSNFSTSWMALNVVFSARAEVEKLKVSKDRFVG